jgi:8-oxo-dGTP diphosphatase
MAEHNAHCSYCGTRYVPDSPWPRTCASCNEITWSNPTPVALVLLPIVQEDGSTGLLMVKRGIEPQLGKLGFPGGFIETGETWQEGAVRELREETGLIADADEVELVDTLSAVHVILIFGRLKPRPASDLAALTPEAVRALSNGETLALEVLTGPQTLAFPLHTLVANRYFASSGGAA